MEPENTGASPRGVVTGVAGAIAIFNAILIGIASLYAGTRSYWVTVPAALLAAAVVAYYLSLENSRLARSPGEANGMAAVAGNHEELEADPAAVGSTTDMDEAFSAFFRSSFPLVLVMVRRIGATREDAEDAAEDAFLEVYRRWSDIEDPERYVRRCAINAYYRRLGSMRRERPSELEELVPKASVRQAESLERDLLTAILALPPQQRTAITLKQPGYSTREIAERLGVSEATILRWWRFSTGVLRRGAGCAGLRGCRGRRGF
jgi:RNA polymerase sigma-70 factor (ECF subfamily)